MVPKKPKTVTRRLCPSCKGTGIDKNLHRRYTTGGRGDRRCKMCNGERFIEIRETGPKRD
jgi:DnaJ-class molecular chaperone